jgi:hypothetical protein
MADLERVLQQFHDSEINAGVQMFFDAGMRIGASVMDQLSLPLRSCALTNADYAGSSQIDLIRILWQCPIFMFLHKGKLREPAPTNDLIIRRPRTGEWRMRGLTIRLACEEVWRVAVPDLLSRSRQPRRYIGMPFVSVIRRYRSTP